jgi:acyl carrier protein
VTAVPSEQIEARLRAFIVDELVEEPFAGEDPLAAGAVDSLGVEQLIDYAEESWGVELGDEDVVYDNFESLSALVALICSKLSEAQGE